METVSLRSPETPVAKGRDTVPLRNHARGNKLYLKVHNTGVLTCVEQHSNTGGRPPSSLTNTIRARSRVRRTWSQAERYQTSPQYASDVVAGVEAMRLPKCLVALSADEVVVESEGE
jgi:hypothetical protein